MIVDLICGFKLKKFGKLAENRLTPCLTCANIVRLVLWIVEQSLLLRPKARHTR